MSNLFNMFDVDTVQESVKSEYYLMPYDYDKFLEITSKFSDSQEFLKQYPVRPLKDRHRTDKLHQVCSVFGKWYFDCNCATRASNLPATLAVKINSYGKGNDLFFTINTKENYFEWCGKVYRYRPYVLAHFLMDKDSVATSVGVYPTSALIVLLVANMNDVKEAADITKILKSLEGSVLVEDLEADGYGGVNHRYGYPFVKGEQASVILKNRMSSIGLVLSSCFTSKIKFRSKEARLLFCKSKPQPTDLAVVSEFFTPEPVVKVPRLYLKHTLMLNLMAHSGQPMVSLSTNTTVAK